MEKERKQLGRFFIWVFLITWLLWTPSILKANGINMPNVLLILSMMASFTPSIVGLYFIKMQYKDEFSSHMKEKLSFRFSKRWFLIITLLFMGMAAISYAITDMFAYVNKPTNILIFPLIFLQILVIGGALGEEIGWRGYAQDKMEIVFGKIKGTLLLGILWSLWHLPLFFMIGTVQSTMPIWQFVIQNTVIAFFYTEIYHKTKGNLIVMIFLHAMANTASAVFPYWTSNTGRYIGLIVL